MNIYLGVQLGIVRHVQGDVYTRRAYITFLMQDEDDAADRASPQGGWVKLDVTQNVGGDWAETFDADLFSPEVSFKPSLGGDGTGLAGMVGRAVNEARKTLRWSESFHWDAFLDALGEQTDYQVSLMMDVPHDDEDQWSLRPQCEVCGGPSYEFNRRECDSCIQRTAELERQVFGCLED